MPLPCVDHDVYHGSGHGLALLNWKGHSLLGVCQICLRYMYPSLSMCVHGHYINPSTPPGVSKNQENKLTSHKYSDSRKGSERYDKPLLEGAAPFPSSATTTDLHQTSPYSIAIARLPAQHIMPTETPVRCSTPRVSKSTGGTSNITNLRPIIAQEMAGEIITCEFADFMETYMVCPSDDIVDLHVENLKGAGYVERRSGSGCPTFTEFRDNKVSEDAFFRPLEEICRVLQALPFDNDHSPHFLHCPNKPIKSTIPGSNNKIDGCIRFSRGDELKTCDIAVVFEFKTTDTEDNFQDDATKAVSANVQIMNDDARRLFVYGVTIEHHTVRLFYHCRSHSAVSVPFSFKEHPRTFIKILLFFLRANRRQLGYDPFVTRNDDSSYVYEILDTEGRPAFYRTVGAVRNERYNIITGRAPRIWKVIQVASAADVNAIAGSEPAVLKDFWLHHAAPTEAQLQANIWRDLTKSWESMAPARKSKIEELYPEFDDIISQETFKHFFLGIEANMVGETTCAPPSFDSTRQVLCRTSESESRSESKREYDRKRRHFVVFKEVCTTISDLKSLGDAMDVLRSSLLGFLFFYCAGWVHRDISIGNIMAHRIREDAPWQAKISDLEYAQKFGRSEGSTDPKTGASYFTAVDLMRGKWSPNVRLVLLPTSHPSKRRKLSAAAPSPISIPPLFATYQHDLESLWWITNFIVLTGLYAPQSQTFARTIFTNSTELTRSREDFFQDQDSVRQKLEAVLPEKVSFFAELLETTRYKMERLNVWLAKHGRLEEGSEYLFLYEEFQAMFLGMDEHKGWQQLPINLQGANNLNTGMVSTSPSQRTPPPKRLKPAGSEEYKPSSSDSGSSD